MRKVLPAGELLTPWSLIWDFHTLGTEPCTLAWIVLFSHSARTELLCSELTASPMSLLSGWVGNMNFRVTPKTFSRTSTSGPTQFLATGLLSVSLETASHIPAAVVQDTHRSLLQKPAAPESGSRQKHSRVPQYTEGRVLRQFMSSQHQGQISKSLVLFPVK